MSFFLSVGFLAENQFVSFQLSINSLTTRFYFPESSVSDLSYNVQRDRADETVRRLDNASCHCSMFTSLKVRWF